MIMLFYCKENDIIIHFEKGNFTMISHDDLQLLKRLWKEYHETPWEPANPYMKFFDRMIEIGFIRRMDGRIGFEKMKDIFIQFTEVGQDAMKQYENDKK
jgi:cold shock CspA family protein